MELEGKFEEDKAKWHGMGSAGLPLEDARLGISEDGKIKEQLAIPD